MAFYQFILSVNQSDSLSICLYVNDVEKFSSSILSALTFEHHINRAGNNSYPIF